MFALELGTCELCGKENTDLRPYGPNEENICFECGMKNEKTTTEKFLARLALALKEARKEPYVH